jgi:LysM repeat protein
MELVKKNMQLCCVKNDYIKMRTVDEDMNVPDAKGDIQKLICASNEAVIENMKTLDRKEYVKGYLAFDVLYICGENGSLEHLEGRLPIEEMFELGDAAGVQGVKASIEIEDFTVKVINSRKINIKALLKMNCRSDEVQEDEIVLSASGDNIYTRKECITFAQLKADGEDTYRVKEDIGLPKNKPNIQRLIWKDVRIKSREARLLDEHIYIKGEIGIFIIYLADENNVVQCYETSIPFEGKLEAGGIDEEMFSVIPMRLQEVSVLVKPDYDGEDRVIALEGIIKLDIKAYSEEESEVILDMYSTRAHVDIKSEEKTYNQIVMKNAVKSRGYSKFKIDDTMEKPLQICYAYGEPVLEEVKKDKNSITIEGCVKANVIYISSDDLNPIASLDCNVPFGQVINFDEEIEEPEYSVSLNVDQINASLIGQEEAEVRTVVGIEILLMKVNKENFITDAVQREMTSAELSEFPGIIGYIAANEESLWDIAKRYKSTVEELQRINKMTTDRVKKGDKVLITR